MRESKYSIKNYLYSLLSEVEDNHHLDSDVIGKIKNINFSKEDDYIKFSFTTSYGKNMDFVSKYVDFKKWFKNNASEHKTFDSFLKSFFLNAEEVEEESMNEIIDDSGNIIPDEDQPNNSTNSMVGSSVWDLERVYKSSIPKSVRFYSGDLGIGIVTW